MRKTIFSKYFTMCAFIILLSTAILGVVFMLFANQYFQNDKYMLLSRNVKTASVIAARGTPGTTAIYLDTMANSVGATFFLTDSIGKTLYCTETEPCRHDTHLVAAGIINTVKEGEYNEMGTLGGIYKEVYYTVGMPVVSNGDEIIGYLFASSSARTHSLFLRDIIKMFIFSAIAVVSFAFIVLYFVTLKITTPLKQMSAAAKKFGRGDFTTRIAVKGNDEISELASALNNMSTDLAAGETVRRSFTANVSHELKTPTTTIAGFIDGILDGTIPPEEHKYYLRIVSEEIKRLSRLIGSMLNLSKIEAGELKVNKSEFNIFDMVARVIISLEQPIDKKHLEVRGLDQDKVMAYGDADLIYQVIYNLTENAIKFADENGYIEFTFNSLPNKMTVTIRNNGSGISKEDLPLIFDRFYKTDRSRGRDKQGVGLGLFIVRTIIHLHNGEIAVRSVPGEYTEFEFALPAHTIKKDKTELERQDF